jgi:hypothetical protein
MPSFIGQLVEHQGKGGKIRYSARQMYSLEWWDMDYVEIHESLEAAVLYMLKHSGEKFLSTIRENLSFPSDEVDWDKLYINEG